MQPIHKNPRFQKDLDRYQSSIDKMIDGREKDEANRLLSNLILEVKRMDSLYLDMIYNKTLGSAGEEFRQQIITIRKNLEEKIK